MEEDSDFFSVKVLKVTHKDLEETRSDDPNPQKTDDLNLIQEFPNMISAKVIKGRMVEMEHSKLVGEAVKFKTVINFDRVLDSKDSLGVTLIPQNHYINKL